MATGTDSLLAWQDSSNEVLIQATAAEVVGNDDVGDGVKDKLNVVSVCCASLVTVDLLRRALVLRLKLCLDVRRCFLVALLTYTSSPSSSLSAAAASFIISESITINC